MTSWSPSTVLELTEKSELKCDFCSQPVAIDGGRLVSPWVFRRSDNNAELMKWTLGGGLEGELRFWRDWSAWVACDGCMKRLF
jgi:hypothetical protein